MIDNNSHIYSVVIFLDLLCEIIYREMGCIYVVTIYTRTINKEGQWQTIMYHKVIKTNWTLIRS